MKRRKRSKLCFLLLLVLLLVPGGTAAAAESEAAVRIPVSQVFETENTVPEGLDSGFQYELVSLGEDNPMPEGTSDNVYAFRMEGNSSVTLGPLVFTHGGTYEYQISQVAGDGENYTYDSTVYQVTVYVKNTADGGLTAETVVILPSGEKTGEITFRNSYKGAEPAGTSGKDQGTSRVRTGDPGNPLLWLVLAVLALAAFLGFWIRGFRRNRTVLDQQASDREQEKFLKERKPE